MPYVGQSVLVERRDDRFADAVMQPERCGGLQAGRAGDEVDGASRPGWFPHRVVQTGHALEMLARSTMSMITLAPSTTDLMLAAQTTAAA